MAVTTILSAMSNPATQAAAFALLEIAISSMRLMSNLDKEEMTPEELAEDWEEIKALSAQADAQLEAAITSHPAWIAVHGVHSQES